MDIADLISADRVILSLSAPSKQRVLHELSKRAAADLNLDLGQVFDVIVAREKLGSTGVGMGTAVPHARLAGAKSAYGIFAHLARPIDCESIDGVHVDLVCFLLLPTGSAPKIPVQTTTETFPLAEANEALRRLRTGELTGAAVLATT